MKTLLPLLMVIFTLLGIIDAGYITMNKILGIVPQCRPPFACETVLKSSWASVGPIPLSVFGLVFYIGFLALAALAVLEVPALNLAHRYLPITTLLFLLGCAGAGFSLYLVFIMGVVLKAWCFYCLLSALNCGILFFLSTALRQTHRA